MSRIGKLPIALPAGVHITLNEENILTVKGKLGELHQYIDPCIKVSVAEDTVKLERSTDEKDHKAKHGLYRALVANMVKGVSEGFTKVQELVGVGYKAEAKGQQLELSLGYSHSIIFDIPSEVNVATVTERGKNPTIILTSIDRQLLGQVAAKIRSLRPPEPYKGKGVLFKGEVIRKKAGKAAAEK